MQGIEKNYGELSGNPDPFAKDTGFLSWTFCNEGHLDFAYNWWFHFNTICPEYHPFVVSISKNTSQKLDELNVPNIYFQPAFDVSDVDSDYMRSSNWSRIMGAKVDITYTFLKRGYRVFYTDDDVILRLPLNAFIERYATDKNLDIVFQKNHMGNLCAGVFFVHPNERTLKLFDRYAGSLPGYDLNSKKYEGDQPFLTRRIYHMNNELGLLYFPTDIIPNGAIWYAKKQVIKDRALLIHYNCIVGKSAKIAKMQEDSVWKFSPENLPGRQLSKMYRNLHQRHSEIEGKKRNCARKILDILFDVYYPNSILDVGCGLGTFLSVAREKGVERIRGLEGEWLDPNRIQIDKEKIILMNLENGFSLQENYELVICLEVAEHLQESSAEIFINSIVSHAPVVLFSAAIPHQGGVHHVNEQFPDYWSTIFLKYDYLPIDFIRERIWKDNDFFQYHLHHCQNIMVFAHRDLIENNKQLNALRECNSKKQLSIVHPEIYLSRLKNAYKQLGQYNNLISLLSQGGEFRVIPKGNGEISVQKLN